MESIYFGGNVCVCACVYFLCHNPHHHHHHGMLFFLLHCYETKINNNKKLWIILFVCVCERHVRWFLLLCWISFYFICHTKKNACVHSMREILIRKKDQNFLFYSRTKMDVFWVSIIFFCWIGSEQLLLWLLFTMTIIFIIIMK